MSSLTDDPEQLPTDLTLSQPSTVRIVKKELIALGIKDDYARKYGELLQRLANAVAEDRLARNAAAIPAQSSFGDKPILELVLERLDPMTAPFLATFQSLRFIGNCCSDNETNCGIAQRYLNKISDCLGFSVYVEKATMVLYNMCLTSDAFVAYAASQRLHEVVMARLIQNIFPYQYSAVKPPAGVSVSTSKVNSVLSDGRQYMLNIIGTVSESAIANENTLTCGSKWADYLFRIIFQVFGKIDVDVLEPLIDAFVAYAEAISDEQLLPTINALMTIFSVLIKPESTLSGEDKSAPQDEDEEDEEDERETLRRCSSKLGHTLAEFSCRDGFASLFDIAELDKASSPRPSESPGDEGGVFATLIRWLKAPGEDLTKQTACIMLGNVAIADNVSRAMVQYGLHKPAINIICKMTDRNLRHAASGLLSHLALPSDFVNKRTLLEDNFLGACDALINPSASKELVDTQLRVSGLTLLRLIVRDSSQMIRIILGQPDMPASVEDDQADRPVSIGMAWRASLVDMFSSVIRLGNNLDPKNPVDLTQIELVARIIFSVMAPQAGSDVKETRKQTIKEVRSLLEYENIMQPLIAVVRNTTVPSEQQNRGEAVLREVFYVLALVAYYEQGAKLVFQQLGPAGVSTDAIRISREVLRIGRDPEATDGTTLQADGEEQAKLRKERFRKAGLSLAVYFLNNARNVSAGMMKNAALDRDAFNDADKGLNILERLTDLLDKVSQSDSEDASRVMETLIKELDSVDLSLTVQQ